MCILNYYTLTRLALPTTEFHYMDDSCVFYEQNSQCIVAITLEMLYHVLDVPCSPQL
jgi:hypothetical protein